MKIKTILVIEDNKLNMKLVNGLIKIGKYRMLEAIDAESGIQLIREQRPDLVLMDIQLPGMDGLSATKIIREDPDLKDIPIVALTSFAMQGDEEKALAAGCTGYITKPIDTRNFLETVSQYLKDDNLEENPVKG
jgi:CheY-like chemotaxis protein